MAEEEYEYLNGHESPENEDEVDNDKVEDYIEEGNETDERGQMSNTQETAAADTGHDERRPTIVFEQKLQAIFNDDLATAASNQRERINKPRLQFYNTYQLEPLKKFRRAEVEFCIKVTLEEALTGKKYCSTTASTLTGALAETIRNRVLEFGYDRYKIITIVHIGPKARQGIEIGSKCLWDPNRDEYAYEVFESYHVFASASVYGIYFD